MERLAGWLRDARRTVVLTGAGISVASGLRPFRGPGGLWTEHPELEREMVAGVSVARIWQAFAPVREQLARATPNPAHVALAELARRAGGRGASFVVITQNVDGLHGCAGQPAVIELHGSLARDRCTACDAPPVRDLDAQTTPPTCVRCGAPMRPDVVLFDEPLGPDEEVAAKRAFRDVDLFVAVGTSGTVWPAASFARWAKFEGARTALVNLTPLDGPDPGYDLILLGRAEEVLPNLVTAGR